MKKIVSVCLCLMLLLSMSSSVLAADVESNGETDSYAVKAEYKPGSTAGEVISVKIDWSEMNFVYNGASQAGWNPQTHNYTGAATEAGWSTSKATITITNDSNTVICSEISYADATEDDYTTSMFFTAESPYIGSSHTTPDIQQEGTPCAVTVRVIPGGSLPETVTNQVQIGTITVKVVSNFTEGNKPEEAILALLDLFEVIQAKGHDPAALSRGTVYFESSQEATRVSGVLSNAADTIYGGATETEINVALNEAITTFYDALRIKE